MKTAISLPDETFRRAQARADQLGMSRSEFFSRAAESYLDHLDRSSLTARIDAAVELTGSDDSSAAAVEAGRQLLAQDVDGW